MGATRLSMWAAAFHAAASTGGPSVAVPSAKQLDFQTNHPKGCFFHFGINTFTGQEHGRGDGSQPPSLFQAPATLDTDQWVRACVAYGGTYAVFTAKHEEGMLNWPSTATASTYNYSIATSLFCTARRAANRSCDLVAEFLASCDKYNVARGLYFTYFNTHCKSMPVGTNCSAILRAAFTELATSYGPIQQFWFDHGDGLFLDLIEKFQPAASILGREWTLVGTEGGYVLNGPDTLWYPTYPTYTGPNETAKGWSAYQCDTSLSASGWFWHPGARPRFNASAGVDLYGLECIGAGAGLILNFPPSVHGVVEDPFVQWAGEFDAEWARWFGPLAAIGRGNGTAATNLSPDSGAIVAPFIPGRTTCDYIVVREDLRYGQRVAGKVGAGSTIGTARIFPLAIRPTWSAGHGMQTNVYGVRLRPTISVAPDGLVHIAELAAFDSTTAQPQQPPFSSMVSGN